MTDGILADLQILSNMRKVYAKDEAAVAAIITLEIVFLTKYRELLTNDKKNQLSHDETAWLKAHDKIKAIVLYRQRTGMGLRESKEFVESQAQKMGLTGPTGWWLKAKENPAFDLVQRYERR